MIITDILLLNAFVKAHELGSFSKAASKIGVTASSISKKISQLESNLGVTLFHRTTRKMSLTEEGQELLITSKRILSQITEIEATFDQNKKAKELEGKIRISSAETYANARLVDKIASFTNLHPKVEIDLVLTNRYLDLIKDDIDIAIRIYRPVDSNLKAFKVEDNNLVFCVSPEYLKNSPVISSIDDLKNHKVMLLDFHAKEVFVKSQVSVNKKINKSLIHVNSGESINQLCIKGYCIALRSQWDVQRYVDDGKLSLIDLDDHLESKTAVYAVYKNEHYLPKRVRLFLDFLKS